MPNTVTIRPVEVPLEVVRGTDNQFQATITDAAGTAQDITGDTLTFTLRTRPDGAVRIQKALTITTPASGLALLTLLDTEIDDLEGLRPGHRAVWHYSIDRLQSGGAKNVYFESTFTILPTGAY